MTSCLTGSGAGALCRTNSFVDTFYYDLLFSIENTVTIFLNTSEQKHFNVNRILDRNSLEINGRARDSLFRPVSFLGEPRSVSSRRLDNALRRLRARLARSRGRGCCCIS